MAVLDIRWNPSARELRQFAVIWFPAACVVVGGAVYVRAGSLWGAVCAGACAVAVGALGWIRPQAVRPLYIALLCLTYPMGWAVSHVLLALVFYGMFTPLGLWMRLWGRDPLQRRFDPEAPSYWAPRPPAKEPKSYFRQF